MMVKKLNPLYDPIILPEPPSKPTILSAGNADINAMFEKLVREHLIKTIGIIKTEWTKKSLLAYKDMGFREEHSEMPPNESMLRYFISKYKGFRFRSPAGAKKKISIADKLKFYFEVLEHTSNGFSIREACVELNKTRYKHLTTKALQNRYANSKKEFPVNFMIEVEKLHKTGKVSNYEIEETKTAIMKMTTREKPGSIHLNIDLAVAYFYFDLPQESQ